jgi:inhibitor of the pro-sigma K processing machinery
MGELAAIFVMMALGLGLVRLIAAPIRLVWKLAVNGAVGLVCLWLVNLAAGMTGFVIPINPVTAVVAGALGLPGIGILALAQLWM